MRLKNHLRSLGVAVVTGVAAIGSYAHMRALALEHGQGAFLASILPLSVDGLLAVASIVLSEDREANRPASGWARASFVIGVAASIAANVEAAQEDAISRLISAWPAVALLFVVEMLVGKRKPAEPVTVPDEVGATDTTPEPAPAEPAELPVKVKPARKPRADKTADRVRRAAAEMPAGTSFAEIAAKAGVSETTVRRHLQPDQPQALLVVGELLAPDAEMASPTGNGKSAESPNGRQVVKTTAT